MTEMEIPSILQRIGQHIRIWCKRSIRKFCTGPIFVPEDPIEMQSPIRSFTVLRMDGSMNIRRPGIRQFWKPFCLMKWMQMEMIRRSADIIIRSSLTQLGLQIRINGTKQNRNILLLSLWHLSDSCSLELPDRSVFILHSIIIRKFKTKQIHRRQQKKIETGQTR